MAKLSAKEVAKEQRTREEMWVAIIDMADAIVDAGFVNHLDIHIVCHTGHEPFGYLLLNRGMDHDELIRFSTLVSNQGGKLNLTERREENGTFNLRVWIGKED